LPLTENGEGAPVITPQKFIAELRMLRTRAKELGLPITADMIGRAIEVCERERDGRLFLQSNGSKGSKLETNAPTNQCERRQRVAPPEKSGAKGAEENGGPF
jgi:hypothetical protein